MTKPEERSVEDQAAVWALRSSAEDFTEQERAALEVWLSDSEAHRAAFSEALELLRLTDAAAELEAEEQLDRELETAARRGRLQVLAAALAVVSLASANAPIFSRQPSHGTYISGAGLPGVAVSVI